MTKPRPLPNNIRGDLEELQHKSWKGIQTLTPIVEGTKMNPEDQIRRVGMALALFHAIHNIIALILGGNGNGNGENHDN